METCPYFQQCEFVLTYVSKVKPHWDDFVTLYCQGCFQDVCKRKTWFASHGTAPPIDLMPTGNRVPDIVNKLEATPSNAGEGS